MGRVQKLTKEARKEVVRLFDDDNDGESINASLRCPAGVAPEEWDAHRLDVAYASLAGFQMDENGFVVQVGKSRDLQSPFGGKKRKKG